MAQHRKRRRKVKKGRVFLAALFIAALFVGCIYGAYALFVASSPYINATPTPSAGTIYTPFPSVSPSPVSTPSPSPRRAHTNGDDETDAEDDETDNGPRSSRRPSEEPGDVSLSSYEDDNYGFACPYPSDFSSNGGGNGDIQLTLISNDGRAYQDIIASSDISSSPAADMRAFLSEHPSAIIEKNSSGSDYYYVLINDNGTYIYRYAAYTEGTAKGFEFGYDEQVRDTYEDYPDMIRADFTLY